MIVFDKRKQQYEIIVTISEKVISSNQKVLKFHSTYSNKSYSIVLPSNTSTYPFRYDRYVITTFDDYEIGTYSYSIVERNPSTLAEIQVLEVGLLKVINDPTPEFLSVTQTETDDDFLVYNNI